MSDAALGDSGLIRSTDQLELPQTRQGVVDLVRRVLGKPFVERITIESGQPVEVVWTRPMSDSLEIDEPEESPDSVLSRVDLDRYTSSVGPKATIADAMIKMSLPGRHATHLFVDDIDRFKDWFGLPQMVELPEFGGTGFPNIMGLRLVEEPSLPPNSVVLLGSGFLEARMNEITHALLIET